MAETPRPIIFGSLFTGIGGFDLGFERAGMACAWQCEINPACLKLLSEKWSDVKRYGDIRELVTASGVEQVDVLCGGDPCPCHSKARTTGASKSPDLAGYFLALVARLRPRWVVRENVLNTATVNAFACALECLGYGVVVVRVDAAPFTCQSRKRDFVIGCLDGAGDCAKYFVSFTESRKGAFTEKIQQSDAIASLCCDPTRMAFNDSFVFENGRLRLFAPQELEGFAGFPRDWTVGFSYGTRARMLGNAVVPAVAEWIGRRLKEAGNGRDEH